MIVLGIALAGVMTVVIAGSNKPQEEAENVLQSTMAATKIDDSTITTTVKSALLADPDVSNLNFKVETRKGKVNLSAYVDNQSQIDRMIAVTRRVSGVKGIKITVSQKGTTRMAGKQVDGIKVANKGKTARFADRSLRNFDTAVVLRNDESPLHGFVDDQSQIIDAIEIARGIDGVHSVSNEMSTRE